MKLSVVVSTAREERETFMQQWKEIRDALAHGTQCPYTPLHLVRGGFYKLLLECVSQEQQSFLEPTLESLARQTLPKQEFEVIIVDRLKDIRKLDINRYDMSIRHVKDKPSKWHGMKPPEGFPSDRLAPFPDVGNARNTGIIMARGEIVLFLDDTIMLSPTTLERVVRWWEEAGMGVKLIRDRYNVINKEIVYEPEFYNHPSLWTDGYAEYSLRGAWSHGFAVPLQWLLTANGFEEVLLGGTVGAEDIDLGLRLHKHYEGYGLKMVLDTKARAYELGHHHIQQDRPPVRDNFLLLNIVRDWNDVRANTRKPTPAELEVYKAKWEKEYNGKMHPYWNVFPTEPFDLREQREAYQRGELRW